MLRLKYFATPSFKFIIRTSYTFAVPSKRWTTGKNNLRVYG